MASRKTAVCGPSDGVAISQRPCPDLSLGANHRVSSALSLADSELPTGISRKHFVDKSLRKVCINRECRVKFTVITSPQHCYRCGEVFCNKCLKQQRKLNHLANFDPQGRFYQVCRKCFHSGQLDSGTSRSRLHEFKQHRSNHRKERLSADDEWQVAEDRLVAGFAHEINSQSSLLRAIQSFTVSLSSSSWRFPRDLPEAETFCSNCSKRFERIVRSRHQCTVCGEAVCGGCSSTDLIVYIQPGITRTPYQHGDVSLSLLYTPGAPSKEPDVHKYLRICHRCTAVRKQVLADKEATAAQSAVTHGFWLRLLDLYDQLMTEQRVIESALEKYSVLVKSLEDGSIKGSLTGSSNVKVLAKAQIDLGDVLYSYLDLNNKLRAVKPPSPMTATLIKYLRRSTGLFYMESKSYYMELKSSLESYLPLKLLEAVQSHVNKNALLCVHLLLRQLGIEVLSQSRSLPEDKAIQIAQYIADLEECVSQELKPLVELEAGTDWQSHLDLSNTMVQQLIQEKPFLWISSWLLKHPNNMMNEVIEQSCSVLERIHLQMMAKTNHTTFQEVKSRVSDTRDSIIALVG